MRTHGDAADVATRERILMEARHLFMQRGFADVSMGEVAVHAGVTKPTLYYHFGDKESLYAEVISAVIREVGGYIRGVTESLRPLRQRLYDLALGYFLHADYTMEPMLRDVGALLGAERATRVRTIYDREFFAPIEALMADGMHRGELRQSSDTATLAHAFLGLLDALTATGGHSARTQAEHQATAHHMVSLFLDGAALPGCERSVLSS